MAVPYVPTSQIDLLQHRPASERDGVFPRKWILAGENVLFETRPSLFGRYWGRLTIANGFAAILLLGSVVPGGPGLGGAGLGLLLFFFLVPDGLILLAWSGRTYALTDQRVLERHGVLSRSFEYARYDEILRLRVTPGDTGDLVFELGSTGGSQKGRRAAGRPTKLVWKSVSMAQNVYEYVQDAFRLDAMQAASRLQRQAFVERAMEDRIVCAYCGALIDLAPGLGSDPKCPRCGAPVRLSVTP